MFEIGEMVVYGNNGICEITGVSQMNVPGTSGERMYYILTPYTKKESKIYSPVDNGKVIMRLAISVDEARELLTHFDEIPVLEILNERFAENQYREILQSGEVRAILSMMKAIMQKRKQRMQVGKRITSTDERYLKKAQDVVFSELMVVLKMERKAVEDCFVVN